MRCCARVRDGARDGGALSVHRAEGSLRTGGLLPNPSRRSAPSGMVDVPLDSLRWAPLETSSRSSRPPPRVRPTRRAGPAAARAGGDHPPRQLAVARAQRLHRRPPTALAILVAAVALSAALATATPAAAAQRPLHRRRHAALVAATLTAAVAVATPAAATLSTALAAAALTALVVAAVATAAAAARLAAVAAPPMRLTSGPTASVEREREIQHTLRTAACKGCRQHKQSNRRRQCASNTLRGHMHRTFLRRPRISLVTPDPHASAALAHSHRTQSTLSLHASIFTHHASAAAGPRVSPQSGGTTPRRHRRPFFGGVLQDCEPLTIH